MAVKIKKAVELINREEWDKAIEEVQNNDV